MESKARFEVEGHIDKKWQDWFEGMELIHSQGKTIIRGTIKDQSYMYGIINKLRDLNLKLISVNQL